MAAAKKVKKIGDEPVEFYEGKQALADTLGMEGELEGIVSESVTDEQVDAIEAPIEEAEEKEEEAAQRKKKKR
jgi:hypothetical protein